MIRLTRTARTGSSCVFVCVCVDPIGSCAFSFGPSPLLRGSDERRRGGGRKKRPKTQARECAPREVWAAMKTKPKEPRPAGTRACTAVCPCVSLRVCARTPSVSNAMS
uniref:Uncharacterized protein n=1 Tax=Leishmania guyanensis TaxID=5670 RepID=A0A1E1J0J4_LEIGU|nr:Hypothetical protein BN36_2845800 [Leishmania guyanensis]